MSDKNKNNLSVIQIALDAKACGAPKEIVDQWLDFFSKNYTIAQETEKLFKHHQYPEHSLDWIKQAKNVETSRFLSSNAKCVLEVMAENMSQGNLFQASQNEILKVTSLGNKRYITKAIKELLEKGCIAVKIEGTRRRAAVYMINPSFATVGQRSPHNEEDFWALTGSKYEYFPEVGQEYFKSEPQKRWEELTEERTYSTGRDQLEQNHQIVYFNKINEPNIQDNTKKSAWTQVIEDHQKQD